jgi:hypothetical protein
MSRDARDPDAYAAVIDQLHAVLSRAEGLDRDDRMDALACALVDLAEHYDFSPAAVISAFAVHVYGRVKPPTPSVAPGSPAEGPPAAAVDLLQALNGVAEASPADLSDTYDAVLNLFAGIGSQLLDPATNLRNAQGAIEAHRQMRDRLEAGRTRH